MGHLSRLLSSLPPGYKALERKELALVRVTLDELRVRVDLWCDALDLFLKAMDGNRSLDGIEVEDERIAAIARWQFFGIALRQSKNALDATMVCDYHLAGAICRYLGELVIFARLVDERPEQARRWYPRLPQAHPNQKEPRFGEAYKLVKERAEKGGDERILQWIYDVVNEQNSYGSHPSQKTLEHTTREFQLSDLVVGTDYDRGLADGMFERGIALTGFHLTEMTPEVESRVPLWADKVHDLFVRNEAYNKSQGL